MSFLKYTYLLILLLLSLKAYPQSVPWYVRVTGNNHTIFVNASVNPTVNGQGLEAGDAIGVFYDSLGHLACGGYTIWNNTNTYIIAYGAEGLHQDFAVGEVFKYKVWKKSTNCVIDDVAVTYTPGMPDETYENDGLSELASLAGTQSFGIELFDIRLVDATCVAGGRVILESQHDIISQISTMVVEVISSDTVLSTTHEVVEVPAGEYKVTVLDKDGCRATWPETFLLGRDPNCEFPVISPNNDGVAEDYYIPYTGTAKIYDRSGELKIQLTIPSAWNATDSSGHPLPMGTYIIVCEGQKDIMVTIVR